MTTCNKLLDIPVHVIRGSDTHCDCGETESQWIPAVPIYDERGKNLTHNLMVLKTEAGR